MPELPEVETTLRGIEPYIKGVSIHHVSVRSRKLRWPIPENFEELITHQTVQHLSRRGKYLCLHLDNNIILIHLGMSGRLSILSEDKPVQRHDHVDIGFANQYIVRYTDPRRFGAILLASPDQTHPLLEHLGVEPLSLEFTSDYLLHQAKHRTMAIKPFLMNNKIVVGIGNIYATEALFLAKIHPSMPTKFLTRKQAERLIPIIQEVLSKAISQGGTTLKDFLNSEGKPGYFAQQLMAYGRSGLPCVLCKTVLQSCVLGQRTTVFCPQCQSF